MDSLEELRAKVKKRRRRKRVEERIAVGSAIVVRGGWYNYSALPRTNTMRGGQPGQSILRLAVGFIMKWKRSVLLEPNIIAVGEAGLAVAALYFVVPSRTHILLASGSPDTVAAIITTLLCVEGIGVTAVYLPGTHSHEAFSSQLSSELGVKWKCYKGYTATGNSYVKCEPEESFFSSTYRCTHIGGKGMNDCKYILKSIKAGGEEDKIIEELEKKGLAKRTSYGICIGDEARMMLREDPRVSSYEIKILQQA